MPSPEEAQDAAGPSFGDGEFLTLRIGGSPSVAERLLLVGKPREGAVHVHEWTSNSWNTAGTGYDVPAAQLLAEVEAAYNTRRSVSADLYRVRTWLTGLG